VVVIVLFVRIRQRWFGRLVHNTGVSRAEGLPLRKTILGHRKEKCESSLIREGVARKIFGAAVPSMELVGLRRTTP
jgi:hypothetical protein